MKIIALEKSEIYGSPKKEQRIPFQVGKNNSIKTGFIGKHGSSHSENG